MKRLEILFLLLVKVLVSDFRNSYLPNRVSSYLPRNLHFLHLIFSGFQSCTFIRIIGYLDAFDLESWDD